MIRDLVRSTPPYLLLALACTPTPDRDAPVEAAEYWAQPPADSVVVGLGQPVDAAARSREEVWVADGGAAAIFSLSPPEGEYVMLGAADREPTEIVQPVKLAVARDIGLAAFDRETERVDLFTFSGEFIRGFSPGFVPAVMGFSRAPLGFTFGVAVGDSGEDRRTVVIRTDLQGNRPDTLLSPDHGPEALRSAVARRGETAMSPSDGGMWVWSREAPETVFDLTPRGTRAITLRPGDRGDIGLLADREREILWLVRPESDGATYMAYDARLAREWTEEPSESPAAADSADAFLGVRTTGEGFRPMVIHDGIVMGTRGLGAGLGMAAYDLRVDRLERPEPGDD
ncbi:MAG: hypothetical protein ACODAA_05305 [Gemmatimonadota bacterium]